MPDPDEQQITLADADGLSGLGRGQVIGGDMIAGLQPPHAPYPRDIEQQATADYPGAHAVRCEGKPWRPGRTFRPV